MNRLLRLEPLLLTLSAGAHDRIGPTPAARQLVRAASWRPDTPPVVRRGGMLYGTDSLKREPHRRRRLARLDFLIRQAETGRLGAGRTAKRRSLTTDPLDSLIAATVHRLRSGSSCRCPGRRTPPSSRRKGWFMSDSMSLSKVCWLSTVLPGYGQVYNKQYWKLPILYGTVGAPESACSSTKTTTTSRLKRALRRLSRPGPSARPSSTHCRPR